MTGLLGYLSITKTPLDLLLVLVPILVTTTNYFLIRVQIGFAQNRKAVY